MSARGRRTLKLIALSYAVKTLLIALAWAVVPDLPQRTLRVVKDTLAPLASASAVRP